VELHYVTDTLLSSPRLKISFKDEEDLIPGIGATRATPWLRQQAIKLAFWRHSPSEYFLTLDPDIFCIRPFSSSDLIINGRALTKWESKELHPDWWSGSASVLGSAVGSSAIGLGITPQMLSGIVCQYLEYFLSSRLKTTKPWLVLLNENQNWTEYSLYTLYCEMNGLLPEYHLPPMSLSLSDHNVRLLSEFKNWSPSSPTNYERSYFVVCQSYLGIPLAEIKKKLSVYLS
jgi:hypothetical protein